MNTKSMTGFGKAQQQVSGKTINVEIKSVNHRYFDFNGHFPKFLNFMEDELKKAVGRHISRGKIDVYVYVEFTETEGVEVVINRPLLESYRKAFSELTDEYGLKDISSVREVCLLPNVLSTQTVKMDEAELCAEILPIVEEALNNFDNMRAVEGERLSLDCMEKLSEIEQAVEKIEALVPQSIAAYKNRMETKIREVLQDRQIDEGRVLTEVAIFADKVAVDEEMVRLKSHIAQFRQMLSISEKPVGKKLDFLIQEMNREINTTGSKCNNVEITRIVVEVKSIIEKIREQIQNIE